jgi:hypothetical protein
VGAKRRIRGPGWTAKRKPDLASDLQLFLDYLCTEWGFCNYLRASDLISDEKPLTVAEFANAVLLAEGMDPEYEPLWAKKIRKKFVERYGQSISTLSYDTIS